MRLKFDRMELSGSLGDLGTLLPIAMGMILINRLDACGVLFTIGAFYILSGLYFQTTSPVQPMKVIGAYALATGLGPTQIAASGLIMGLLLLVIGATGAINLIGRYTPKSAVRGVQLGTGAMLMAKGVSFMTGGSGFQALRQAAEPYLAIQALGPVPIGIVIGVLAGGLTLFLLNNRRFPAGLMVVVLGFALGLALGNGKALEHLRLGVSLPQWLPFGLPANADWGLALMALVLPQIPMTIGNAVIADADLAREYFGPDAKKNHQPRALLCHGPGEPRFVRLRRHAALHRRRRPGGPLPLRRAHRGLQHHDRRGVSGPGRIPGRAGGCAFQPVPHGGAGRAFGLCRGPAGHDHCRHDRAQGPVRVPSDFGHHPGFQPGRRLCGRNLRGLGAEMAQALGLRP